MFWNKKNKNKSHIKREWSAEIGKLNYITMKQEIRHPVKLFFRNLLGSCLVQKRL